MDNTKKAFDEMLANILRTIGSSKFWITVLILVAAAIATLNLKDPVWQAVAAIIGILTGGGGYIGAKTYQNTHGVNAASVPGVPSVALAKTSPQVAMAVATGNTSNGSEPPLPIPKMPNVRDRIDAIFKLIDSPEPTVLFDILLGLADTRIKAQIEHLLMLQPQLGDVEAARQIVNSYAKINLSDKECVALNAMAGMWGAVAATMDKNIVQSKIDAYNRTPNKESLNTMMLELREGAKAGVKTGIIGEVASRAKSPYLPLEDRIQALMEFGVDEYHARQSKFQSGTVWVWQQDTDSNGNLVKGGEMVNFNPYALAGFLADGS